MFSMTLFFVGLILYVYLVYPILIILLSIVIRNKVSKSDAKPSVALMIAAYNEEANIVEKIKNSLSLDYPEDKLKIYVVSDASSDNTDNLVRSFDNERVSLIRIEGRVGKTEARNQAIDLVNQEIIVFSDATTVYEKNALKELVKNFHDPNIGMVTGQLRYVIPKKSSMGLGQKIFWTYESRIKKAQTSIGTLTGSLGCMTAFRRTLYTKLPANIIEDFTGPLLVIKKGYRVVYEERAICYEEATTKSTQEFNMRVRVIRGGMTGLLYAKSILNPIRFPIASFQLISHKVLRWFVPVFAILAYLTNAICFIERSDLIVLIFFSLQNLFYFLVLLATFLEKINMNIRGINIIQYLFTVNLASLKAIYLTCTKNLEATWETRREMRESL